MSAFSWDTSSVRNYFVLAISLACVIRMSVCPVLVTSRTLPYYWLNIRPPALFSASVCLGSNLDCLPRQPGHLRHASSAAASECSEVSVPTAGKASRVSGKDVCKCALSKMIPSQILLASSQGQLSHALALPPSRQS